MIAINVFILSCATVSRALREATYPFLALICLHDNRMTVVGRMEGKSFPPKNNLPEYLSCDLLYLPV